MTSPTSATAPVSPPLSSPCSPGTIDNNHCTNKQPQPRVGASFSLPSYLVVDEIDLKLHLQHQQQQLKQPQPHHSGNGIEIVTNNNINSNTHTIHQGHSPERIQGVIMNKQQLKDLSNHHHHHPMHPPLSQNKRSKRRQRSAHSPPSSPDEDAIPTTIGGTSSSPTEEYKACPCCRRYIRLGEFCSSSRRGCGETSTSSLSYSHSSWGSIVLSDGNGWSSSLRSVEGGAGIERVGVAGRNGSVCGRSMAEYSMDTTEEDVVGVLTERGRKDDRRQSNSSRPDGDDDHSTVLAGLSLESSDDDDDDDDTATNIREDGNDSIGVSLIQGAAFPGVDRIARGLPDGSYGDAAEGPSTKDPRVIMIRESVNPIHCGGGLAAYDVKDYLKMSDKKKKTQTMNHDYSGVNTCVEYTVTKTIVQGWLHKKGTGNDFLGMRWWKPRWVTLALAQIPGHLVETPILLTHRAPGVPFPPNVIVLSENTVVMAIERTNAAENIQRHSHELQKQQPQPPPSQRHDDNPLDRLVNLADLGHHPRDELGNQPIKEEWNTHCFQIVNTESHPSVSRIFTAPRKERNEWVFAIHRAIMEYEKRLAKARWRLQRPRSPSPVRMDANESTTTTKTDSSGGGSAGGGRRNGRRAGLPPTSPRRVRSPSPVSSRRDDGNAYRRNHHNADVGGGGMKNDQRLTVTP